MTADTQGFSFEVSWETRKATLVRGRGIELSTIVEALDDPAAVLEPSEVVGFEGQYRAIGRTATGRLITFAIEITYLDEREEAVGLLRVYTTWHSSRAEDAAYYGQR